MKQFLSTFKALADETRFRLLNLLLTQDLCGKALARRLGVSEAAVSQHLKVLKEAGLVEGEKRGYWIHYSVQREVLKQVIHELDRLASQSVGSTGPCHRLNAESKGYEGREVKAVCQCCCEHPEKLKGKSEDCTPEQIRECHGDANKHACEGEKKKER